MKRRQLVILASVVAVLAAATVGFFAFRFPPDTTPQGAYMRIARAISGGEPAGSFAYLEDDAQHATFTIRDYASKSAKRISEAYPAPERDETLVRYQRIAACDGAPEVWALLADERGWIRRLRRDLSGVASVEVAGQRATVVTARGTRYAFRRRNNGIWGLTLFTVELTAEAERLARDWELVQDAAADYERAKKVEPAASSSASH